MTVYVVQKQMKLDERTGDLVPRFPTIDLAKTYGELRYLLSPSASPFRPEPIIEELKNKLTDFSDDDHLLLIGNPILIGLAVSIAADYNSGSLKVLQWNGSRRGYILVELHRIFPDIEE